MNDFDTLLSQLKRRADQMSVRSISADAVEISLPDPRQSHDLITLSLEREGDDWVMSDLGASAFLLGDEFDSVIDAMLCAGSPFTEDNGSLILRCPSDASNELADRVLRFAAHIGSVPVVWHSLACAIPRREQAPSTVTVMAREARGHLVQAVPRAEGFLSVELTVTGALERVKAPLQFRAGQRQRPKLVAGCIDFTAGPQGETAAKKLTSYLWDTVREIPSLQRYVIVRGSSQQVDRVAHLYDSREVTTVSSDNLTALTYSVEELVQDLVG